MIVGILAGVVLTLYHRIFSITELVGGSTLKGRHLSLSGDISRLLGDGVAGEACEEEGEQTEIHYRRFI